MISIRMYYDNPVLPVLHRVKQTSRLHRSMAMRRLLRSQFIK